LLLIVTEREIQALEGANTRFLMTASALWIDKIHTVVWTSTILTRVARKKMRAPQDLFVLGQAACRAFELRWFCGERLPRTASGSRGHVGQERGPRSDGPVSDER